MKPKVGVVFLADEFARSWYIDLEFVNELEDDTKKLLVKLQSSVDVVSTGLSWNASEAAQAASTLRKHNLDLLIVCYVMWSSDKLLLSVMKGVEAETPLLLWGYYPHKSLNERITGFEMNRDSGIIGALMNVSTLKRVNRKFLVVVGNSEDAVSQIRDYAICAKLANQLKATKIGLLPSRMEGNMSMWVDESRLLAKVGPRVKHISLGELKEEIEKVSSSELDSYIDSLKSDSAVLGVSDKSLRASAQVCLGISRIVERHGLDALAVQDLDGELHRTLKTRPALYVKSLFDKGVVPGSEGDVYGVLSALILQRLTQTPGMFSEIFNIDEDDNTILMGHIGIVNVGLASNPSKVKIIPDYEFCRTKDCIGASTYFTYKEGTVTLLSLIEDDDSYKLIVTRGKSLPVDESLEGYPHLLVRLDTPVRPFLEEALKLGATQHWAVIYDDAVSKVEKLAEIIGLRSRTII